MAIAKKKAKRAVDRNRIKRVVRESFRHQQQSLAGLDIVVMNKPDAVSATNQELRASIDAIWAELGRTSNARESST
jgi:ribonuclease P protein component